MAQHSFLAQFLLSSIKPAITMVVIKHVIT